MSDKKLTLLLPTTGEPLVLYCWLQNMQKYSHLVDNMFASIDMMGRVDPMECIFVQNYLIRLFRRFPNLRYSFDRQISQHGLNIKKMLEMYEPDINDDILLMEEDDFILNSTLLEGHIKYYFENNIDVCAVARGSATPYMLESLCPMVSNRKDLEIEDGSDCNDNNICFWPTLFLSKKKHFLNSSKDFISYNWNKGDEIKIGEETLVLDRECHGDTFVKFTFELYNNPDVKKIKVIKNPYEENGSGNVTLNTYHSGLHDNQFIDQVLEQSVNFHVGSLSTFMSNKLWKPWPKEHYIHSYVRVTERGAVDSEVIELYRRCLLMYEMLKTIEDPNDFEFYGMYKDNLERLIEYFEKEKDVIKLVKDTNITGLEDGKLGVDLYSKVCERILK